MGKITRAEAQEKSNDKAKALNAFCKQLQIVIVAEQRITSEGFIKNVAIYNDVEEYDLVDESNDENNEQPIEAPINDEEETTDLREENA